MKMLYIGFLKTEPNQTGVKIQNSVSTDRFSQNWLQQFGDMYFTLSHSQFIFQHDRIKSGSIFLHAMSLHS